MDLPKSNQLVTPEVMAQVGFAESVAICQSASMEFKHPLTGDTLTRSIGRVNSDCVLTEQMPNNGKMTCTLRNEDLGPLAMYYEDIALASSVETNYQNGKAGYKINDKVVENPLQEFLTDGTCVITGY